MGAGLPPPKQVFCHGYLTVKGQKISKSMPATKVDPNAIAGELGVDPLRYFVLREYALGGDGDFTYESLFQRHQSDLGNDLGNLLNRTLSMVHVTWAPSSPRAPDQRAPPASCSPPRSRRGRRSSPPTRWRRPGAWSAPTTRRSTKRSPGCCTRKDELDGCRRAGRLLRGAALGRADGRAGDAESARARSSASWGAQRDEGTWPPTWGWPGGTLAEPKPVFPRVEPDRQRSSSISGAGPRARDGAGGRNAPAATRPQRRRSRRPPPGAPSDISIDDFAKIDLRAAKVLAGERVPKADKLLKLTLDVGGAPRTVLSGIATAYTPETIVGKTVIYLSNLAPSKIRGIESQGMILAAGDADVLGLSAIDRDVPPGTKIR